MCKFCESKEEIELAVYDNSRLMEVCFDQYSGVGVWASVSMHGNMLTLDASGSYRSSADCYYESEGLDISSKRSRRRPPSRVRIKYCPMCGREITSNEYERAVAEENLEVVRKNVLTIEGVLDTPLWIMRSQTRRGEAEKDERIIKDKLRFYIPIIHTALDGSISIEFIFLARKEIDSYIWSQDIIDPLTYYDPGKEIICNHLGSGVRDGKTGEWITHYHSGLVMVKKEDAETVARANGKLNEYRKTLKDLQEEYARQRSLLKEYEDLF